MTKPKKFADTPKEFMPKGSETGRSPLPQPRAKLGKINTYGLLTQKLHPSRRKLISVPIEVIDFIEGHKGEGAAETIIYSHMLLVAKRIIEQDLLNGDYELLSGKL